MRIARLTSTIALPGLLLPGLLLPGLLLLSLARSGHADVFAGPFLGADLGGDASDTALVYGGSLGFMVAKKFGIEADFSHAPDFLGPTGAIGGGSVTTFMGNLIVGGEAGQVRPYVSGGVGLIRLRLEGLGNVFSDLTSNDFGINLGGGVMSYLSDRVGLRGDLRYFRSIRDQGSGDSFDVGLGSFDFWRLSGGVVLRF